MVKDQIEKLVAEIQANHHKILDDWCKAYLAQRYIEGKSINPGSFTLCQQNLSWAQNEVGFKYWFEDGKPERRCLDCERVINTTEIRDRIDNKPNDTVYCEKCGGCGEDECCKGCEECNES